MATSCVTMPPALIRVPIVKTAPGVAGATAGPVQTRTIPKKLMRIPAARNNSR